MASRFRPSIHSQALGEAIVDVLDLLWPSLELRPFRRRATWDPTAGGHKLVQWSEKNNHKYWKWPVASTVAYLICNLDLHLCVWDMFIYIIVRSFFTYFAFLSCRKLLRRQLQVTALMIPAFWCVLGQWGANPWCMTYHGIRYPYKIIQTHRYEQWKNGLLFGVVDYTAQLCRDHNKPL